MSEMKQAIHERIQKKRKTEATKRGGGQTPATADSRGPTAMAAAGGSPAGAPAAPAAAPSAEAGAAA
eukprot:5855955-Pyramimonas_sp.AAC.1